MLNSHIGDEVRDRFVHVPPRRPLTDEESVRLVALENEAQALESTLKDPSTGDEDYEQALACSKAIDKEIAAITNGAVEIPAAILPRLGAFLLPDQAGAPSLDPRLFSEQLIANAVEPAPDAFDDERALDVIVGTDKATSVAEPVPTEVPDEAPSKAKEERPSQRLVDELAIQRRDILRVNVAANPAVAIDLAIFLMMDGAAMATGSHPVRRQNFRALPPCAS